MPPRLHSGPLWQRIGNLLGPERSHQCPPTLGRWLSRCCAPQSRCLLITFGHIPIIDRHAPSVYHGQMTIRPGTKCCRRHVLCGLGGLLVATTGMVLTPIYAFGAGATGKSSFGHPAFVAHYGKVESLRVARAVPAATDVAPFIAGDNAPSN